MDYKKLWNDLKENMLKAAEEEATPGGNYEKFLFHASDLLRKMVEAEVRECRANEKREKELDTAFLSFFSKKGE